MKFDVWYKGLIVVGGIFLFLASLFDFGGYLKGVVQLISGGLFVIGIGEWKNHGASESKKREPTIEGMVIDGVGILLLIVGIAGSVVLARQ